MTEREKAESLLKEWVDAKSLWKHSLAVEGAMRGLARHYEENVELWGACGLLHDIDFQKHPKEHLQYGPKILTEAGYDRDFVQAVAGHGDFTGVARETKMAKALYAVDQLSSFVVACALVRPERLEGMKVKSVMKKVKDKGFAKAVDRQLLQKGAQELEFELRELMEQVIIALQQREKELTEIKESLF